MWFPGTKPNDSRTTTKATVHVNVSQLATCYILYLLSAAIISRVFLQKMGTNPPPLRAGRYIMTVCMCDCTSEIYITRTQCTCMYINVCGITVASLIMWNCTVYHGILYQCTCSDTSSPHSSSALLLPTNGTVDSPVR